MSLEELAKKLARMAAARKAEANGLRFNLLGLFVRESDGDPVDLVAAAPGLNYGDLESFRKVSASLVGYFDPDDFAKIARIVILGQETTILKKFHNTYSKKKGLVDFQLQTEGGAVIKQAYVVIASAPRDVPMTNRPSASTQSQKVMVRLHQKKPRPRRKNTGHT